MSSIFFIFFFEETNYQRAPQVAALPSHPTSGETSSQGDAIEKRPDRLDSKTKVSRDFQELQELHSVQPGSMDTSEPKTYMARLKLFDRKLFRRPNRLLSFIKRPLILVTLPVVAYSGFCVGCYQMWLIVLNGTQSMIFAGSPYNFSTLVIGLPYAAAGVGLILG